MARDEAVAAIAGKSKLSGAFLTALTSSALRSSDGCFDWKNRATGVGTCTRATACRIGGAPFPPKGGVATLSGFLGKETPARVALRQRSSPGAMP
jgi:hypothetical protein